MKMLKHENSLFPYSLRSTVNLPEWRLNDADVTLISFLRLFTEAITPEKAFFQNWMTNVVKTDETCEEFWRNQQNRNFSFRDFLLRYEPGQPGPYQK